MDTKEVQLQSGKVTAADVKAMVQAKLKAAYDSAMAKPKGEVAGPYLWWNLYSFGPYQDFAPDGPLPPNQVIHLGDPAFIGTVLLLNPAPILPPPPGLSPGRVLSDFGLPYSIRYQTCNLTTCTVGVPAVESAGALVPGVFVYVDVIEFAPAVEGLFETNVSARILGVPPAALAPGFAGFARWIYDFDPELFLGGPTPGFQFDLPAKFMVYA